MRTLLAKRASHTYEEDSTPLPYRASAVFGFSVACRARLGASRELSPSVTRHEGLISPGWRTVKVELRVASCLQYCWAATAGSR